MGLQLELIGLHALNVIYFESLQKWISFRGSLANGMVMERYFNITAGFNAYDIWFQKSRYK